MKIDNDNFDNISIPEGLAQRLSDNIDRWAHREVRQRRNHRLLIASACMMMSMAVVVSILFFHPFNDVAEQRDCFTESDLTPEETARAMSYAFGMLQHSLDESIAALEQANTRYTNLQNTTITLYISQDNE